MIEDMNTEFKSEYVDDINRAIIALANTSGGKIYIGLHDDGTVKGVSDIDKTMLKVTNSVRDTIKPDVTLFVKCEHIEMDGKPIVVVNVYRGTHRPYYLAGKGIRPEGVYVRQGASTVPASETVILEMIKQTSGDQYEEARSINQKLTFDYISAVFKEKGLAFGPTQKRSLSLIGADGMYSNLAYLLSDQCKHSIKLAIFEGTKKTVFKDRKDCSGSLLQQLNDAYDFIDRYNRTRAEFSKLNRIDRRDYPEEAIRETLLNVLIHRDYSFSASTLISLFDDRIEFVSIGGLLTGVSKADILLGVSALRNHNLADVFYRLRLIEAYGTGLQKIINSYDGYADQPKIEISDHAFKITLPNINWFREVANRNEHAVVLTDKEMQIVSLAEKAGKITRKEIESALGISQASAVNYLRTLVDRGIIKKSGQGKLVYYQRNN